METKQPDTKPASDTKAPTAGAAPAPASAPTAEDRPPDNRQILRGIQMPTGGGADIRNERGEVVGKTRHGDFKTYLPGQENALARVLTPDQLRRLIANGSLAGDWEVDGKTAADHAVEAKAAADAAETDAKAAPKAKAPTPHAASSMTPGGGLSGTAASKSK